MSGGYSYRENLEEEESESEKSFLESFESSGDFIEEPLYIENSKDVEMDQDDTPQNPTLQDLVQALLLTQRSVAPRVTDIVKLPEFNGQRSEWDSWKLIARNKIAVDGPTMPSEAACFSAIHSKIQGSAARTIAAYAAQVTNNNTANATALLDYLEGIYGDPARVQRSITELHSIRQSENESFAAYLPRFESVLTHAQGGNWPENVKIAFLLPSLSTKYRRHLPGSKSYSEYRDLTTDLQNIGSRVAADEAYDKRLKGSNSQTFTQSSHRQNTNQRAEPMEGVTFTGAPRVNVTSGSKCSCRRNNHTCGRRRASWVSAETRQYRRNHRLCMRCGHPGHIEYDCSFLPASNPARTNTLVAASDPALALPEPEEEGKE